MNELFNNTPEAMGLEAKVVGTLQTIYDPEIPVNIYDLGLIYDIDIDPEGSVKLMMTLTSPACPVAGTLPPLVESRVRSVRGVKDCAVELVWDPPWTSDLMSDEAKLDLGLL